MWIVAVIMVCLLLGSALMAIPYLGLIGIFFVVGGFVYFGTLLLKDSGQKRYDDPYDLGLLREVHERKQFDAADETQIPESADIVCPHCGHTYGGKFRVCPMCKMAP